MSQRRRRHALHIAVWAVMIALVGTLWSGYFGRPAESTVLPFLPNFSRPAVLDLGDPSSLTLGDPKSKDGVVIDVRPNRSSGVVTVSLPAELKIPDWLKPGSPSVGRGCPHGAGRAYWT